MKILDHIILFDGECNFCNRNVQFVIKRDPKAVFKFASQQSEIGQQLLKKYNISKEENSLILLQNGRLFTKSTAALKISKNLHFFWKILYIFIVVPKPIRDYGYDLIAKNRYKWFKDETCSIPSSSTYNRFL